MKIKDEVLGSDDLSCFVTITTLGATPPFVSTVLGLCCYSGGLGALVHFKDRCLVSWERSSDTSCQPMVQVGPDAAHLDALLLPTAQGHGALLLRQ
eukprot:scaffold80708_cov51-Attheya_sp.AAC.4